MRELGLSIVKMINLTRRKGGVYPVMSLRQIITGRKMVLPSYPPGSSVYAAKGGTTNVIEYMRTFATLHLRPNDKGGGHFVYNINTLQRCSPCRGVSFNRKPIPLDDNVIETNNKQTAEALHGIEFTNINMKTTVNNFKERDNDSDSDFEDDDKLYETSDDSTVDGDNDLSDGPNQLEEDQQQQFNVPELNDIDEDNSNGKNEGMGEEVDEENDPVQENIETVREIEDKDGTEEEENRSVHSDNKSVYSDNPSIETVDNDDNEELRVIYEQSTEPQEPVPPGTPAVRKLD